MTTQEYYFSAARRALARAYEGGCHKRFEMFEAADGTAEGLYICEDGEPYFVTLAQCTCKGNRYGNHLCRHMLSLADLTGQLNLFIPGCYSDEKEALNA